MFKCFCSKLYGKVHLLNSGKVSIQIQLKVLPELSEWTSYLFSYCARALSLHLNKVISLGKKLSVFA